MHPDRVKTQWDGEPSPSVRIDFSKIAALLAAQAEDLCRNVLLTSGKRCGREWKCGDIDNSPGKSLAVTLWGRHAGLWFDAATKQGGNLLQLIALQNQCPIADAAQIALEILHLDPSAVERSDYRPTPVRHVQSLTVPTEAPDNVRRLWHSTVPLFGTHGHDYLLERGILVSPPPTIRFHPRLPYWQSVRGREKPVCMGHFPALVCGIAFYPNNRIAALQRIYLDPQDPVKLKLPDPEHADRLLDPKKTLGAFKGGAVRLSPYGGRLALAEGVETALTVLQFRPGFAVWATLGTTGMAEVLVPKGGTKLVCIDNDEPGVQAARALIERIRGPGEDIGVTSAKTDGLDFNDIIAEAS